MLRAGLMRLHHATWRGAEALNLDVGLILAKHHCRRVGTESQRPDEGRCGYITAHSVTPSGGRSRLVGGGARCVAMIFMAPPQPGQVSTGRGLKYAAAAARLTLSRSCTSWINRLLLGYKKPKLRARRKRRGKTWRNTSHRKSAPGRVRVCMRRVLLS